jgi:hypothetical protein
MVNDHPPEDVQATSSTPPSSLGKEAEAENQHIETIRTISRVPGNTHYYEKDGLRTYGDGEDHDHEPPMSFRRFMSLVAMAFLWTGSQIPVYLFGQSSPPDLIACDLPKLQVASLLTFMETWVVLTAGYGLCWPISWP